MATNMKAKRGDASDDDESNDSTNAQNPSQKPRSLEKVTTVTPYS